MAFAMGWVLGFAGTSWASRRKCFHFSEVGWTMVEPCRAFQGVCGRWWRIGRLSKGVDGFPGGVFWTLRCCGGWFWGEGRRRQPALPERPWKLKTNADIGPIRAKAGGDSPLAERPLKLRTNAVVTHKSRQEGERLPPTLPPIQAGHTHVGAGTKLMTFTSRSSPPSL